MKFLPSLLILTVLLSITPSCSLVTVPVKVAGGIVETTVKTTGDIATAPFKMGSGGEEEEEKTSSKDKEKEKEKE